MNPILSVIMSVYNGSKYLDDSINSILNQTFEDFEFIIINDGSVDNSWDIKKKWSKLDTRIITIKKRNIGLTKSINKAIMISKRHF
jgi:Glycosyltransferases involved in cell wall biogenesis